MHHMSPNKSWQICHACNYASSNPKKYACNHLINSKNIKNGLTIKDESNVTMQE